MLSHIDESTCTIVADQKNNNMNISWLRRLSAVLTKAEDKLDGKLENIKNYLESTGLGYRGSLVDSEGFPLPDVDHYKIMASRGEAARLLNDRKQLELIMCRITQTEDGNPGDRLCDHLARANPFGFIDFVDAKSPAEQSGIKPGDLLISFGSATILGMIPSQIIEGVEINVRVFRITETSDSIIDIKLIPKSGWGETSSLVGASILPIPE